MARRDNHQAARALADWARSGFARAQESALADTYGVSTRTLWRWKDALNDDSELSALYRDALQAHLTSDWSDHLNATLTAAITRMLELISVSDDLSAVNEAFAKLGEVALAKEMLSGALNGSAPARSAPLDGADAGDFAASAFGPN